MDQRKRPQGTSEQAEDSNKRGKFDFKALFPSKSTTGTSSTSRIHPTPGTDSHVQEQVGNPQEDLPNAIEPRSSALNVESHEPNTRIAMPIDGSVSYSGQLGPNTDTAEGSVSMRAHRAAAPDATSVKWKNLKGLGKPAILRPVKNLFGPIKEIAEVLVDCVDNCEVAGTAKAEYDELRARLEALLEDLKQYFGESCSPKMTSSMQSLCKSIREELGFIRTKQGRSKGARYLAAKDEADVILACCRRVEGYLERLLVRISYYQTRKMIFKAGSKLNANLSLWKIAHDQATESYSDRMLSLIDRLPTSSPAWYDSAEGAELKRRECTPGTRIDVLATVIGWVRNKGDGAVYWLNGMAGTGKTTIAYSTCVALDSAHRLGASFFCSRLRKECRNVNMILPSIAYQLARFSRPFQSALCTVLQRDPDIHERILQVQFDGLIREPILAVQHTLPEELVVVIDALDECDNKESTRRVLEVLLSGAAGLPLRFVVSSRPEPEIRDQMTRRTESRLVLHELDKGEVQADIRTYLREGLARMSPSEEQISALAEAAGILFIYAATAVRYIGYDNFSRSPNARLSTILDRSRTQRANRHKDIDDLYMTILEAALGDKELDEDEQDDMRQVLHTVICAREPLTVGGLSELLQLKGTERVRAALRPLWSVLHIVGANELVTTLHASFPDFMFNSTRSQLYHCNSDAYNNKLAEHCFERIKRAEPQFNICRLESSYLPDEIIPNIEQQVAEAIPHDLLYACRFWTDHVDAGKCVPALVEPLQEFLSARLLLWMEILNLNKQMSAGTQCVKTLVKWCNEFEKHWELVELARDAERFVETFASNPISQSTPHIYVSMLAFWPKSTPIAKHYAKYTRGPVKAEGTALNRRQMAHLATWAFDEPINVTSVSPLGQYIALAHNRSVVVVQSSSGRVAFGPFTYHDMAVRSIAFSPGGARLYAGFVYGNDATILGWEFHTRTSTGDPILGPLQLKGHTSEITCLRFSPDCTRIATGADDKTIRVWHVENRNLLHRLETHGMVWDAIFSPDGTQIAAGFEKALHIWDSKTGVTTLGPLTTSVPVHRLCFSPDKSRIIYASITNKMIYVLDAQSGEKILGPIEGHKDTIWYIGCSPDGRYIVSGSRDRTVCVWDAQNGNMVLGPLEAHTDLITSVSFSPDGSRIISACEDGLVCTWDAWQRNPSPNSGNAPLDRITCVKFSPDGTRWSYQGAHPSNKFGRLFE
ncbi:unnamed protein product [Rhizoctonia solani]|uniref:Nephrocystin 3-like N-terminal domain-containing protein n=1 Tax=Rhizoctonia solani TaxID=456999 RepID=A0A8H3H7U4_9AGAM|nr:unnamed protein product [Rhizoctonia solani]